MLEALWLVDAETLIATKRLVGARGYVGSYRGQRPSGRAQAVWSAEVLKSTIRSLRRDGEQLAEVAVLLAACCPGAVQPALRHEQARGKIVGGMFRLRRRGQARPVKIELVPKPMVHCVLEFMAKLNRCRTSGSAPFSTISQRPFCEEVQPDTGKSTSVRTRTRGSSAAGARACWRSLTWARERRNLISQFDSYYDAIKSSEWL